MGPFVVAGSERARRAMLNEGHHTNRKGPRYKATVTSAHRGAIRRQRIKTALFDSAVKRASSPGVLSSRHGIAVWHGSSAAERDLFCADSLPANSERLRSSPRSPKVMPCESAALSRDSSPSPPRSAYVWFCETHAGMEAGKHRRRRAATHSAELS